MAEREGFEPPIPVKVCPLSRRIVSTTHAPLRVGNFRRGVWSAASDCEFGTTHPLNRRRPVRFANRTTTRSPVSSLLVGCERTIASVPHTDLPELLPETPFDDSSGGGSILP